MSSDKELATLSATQYMGAITVLWLLIHFPTPVFSQSVPQLLQIYVGQIGTGQQVTVPASLKEQANALEVITSATKHFDDSLSLVRVKMYGLVAEVGMGVKDNDIQSMAIEKLVNATTDHQNLSLLLTHLELFNAQMFSSIARDSLISLVRQNPPYLDQLIRLLGSLQIKELINDLRVLSGAGTTNQRVRWAAVLALSRMGDDEATQSMMKRVQRLSVNDDVVYEVFPDLIYTRQRQAIDYLIIELKSDDKKCYTADAEDETPITCAYRIMEMLAPVIEKYPLQADASGDIKTKDYKKSLATVRNWFEKNKDYKIVR